MARGKKRSKIPVTAVFPGEGASPDKENKRVSVIRIGDEHKVEDRATIEKEQAHEDASPTESTGSGGHDSLPKDDAERSPVTLGADSELQGPVTTSLDDEALLSDSDPLPEHITMSKLSVLSDDESSPSPPNGLAVRFTSSEDIARQMRQMMLSARAADVRKLFVDAKNDVNGMVREFAPEGLGEQLQNPDEIMNSIATYTTVLTKQFIQRYGTLEELVLRAIDQNEERFNHAQGRRSLDHKRRVHTLMEERRLVDEKVEELQSQVAELESVIREKDTLLSEQQAHIDQCSRQDVTGAALASEQPRICELEAQLADQYAVIQSRRERIQNLQAQVVQQSEESAMLVTRLQQISKERDILLRNSKHQQELIKQWGNHIQLMQQKVHELKRGDKLMYLLVFISWVIISWLIAWK
ncbi:hypothetical protein HDU85_007063 [Gaertneriomyces sp. JEL0708]|nr:hypothetical protein HDU85_007063 [Gaertneriomyces sp. JEL0708]